MTPMIDASDDQTNAGCRLMYTEQTRGLAPIPPAEQGLPTAVAEPFFQVSKGLSALEGPAFDRNGNLMFVDVYDGNVMKLTPEGQLSTLYNDKALCPAGVAIHRDGRIFLGGIGNFAAGAIVSIEPDGSNPQVIVPPAAGYVVDDLVFDSKGGIYFTDFKGSSTEPCGGVYYVTPDSALTLPVIPKMAAANGVALSPDGSVLWATEFCNSRLLRVELATPVLPKPFGTSVPYRFTGRAPDSMRTDANGNVYVAMYLQARVLVFNPFGIPIGQIVLPGRENNHFLKLTSMAFRPGSREMVIVARDEIGGNGSMIFRAEGLAEGTRMYSHQ
ncbi:putative lactonase [Advenella mimigardefordensis DPN7]|uniref:Putative lactonase n=2 Tax=Advenella mimigardefordensis TaxID=302406 RepID=W0PDI6_ADVMD|nr:putative lactonase [Advenella mimigardefordensis DPN7]